MNYYSVWPLCIKKEVEGRLTLHILSIISKMEVTQLIAQQPCNTLQRTCKITSQCYTSIVYLCVVHLCNKKSNTTVSKYPLFQAMTVKLTRFMFKYTEKEVQSFNWTFHKAIMVRQLSKMLYSAYKLCFKLKPNRAQYPELMMNTASGSFSSR